MSGRQPDEDEDRYFMRTTNHGDDPRAQPAESEWQRTRRRSCKNGKMKFGMGDFDLEDERSGAINSALEDAKGGVATASLRNGIAGSGSAMPPCGIVLPHATFKKTERVCMLACIPFSPFIHIRSRRRTALHVQLQQHQNKHRPIFIIIL